jgi:arylsulfatase A-like enzyme
VEDRAVISLDLFSTALAAAEIDLPQDAAARDGMNLLPHLTGEGAQPIHDVLYWRVGANAALRQGDWKIVRQGAGRRAPSSWQLYNLANDVAETRDVAAGRPEKLNQLSAAWAALDAAMPQSE